MRIDIFFGVWKPSTGRSHFHSMPKNILKNILKNEIFA